MKDKKGREKGRERGKRKEERRRKERKKRKEKFEQETVQIINRLVVLIHVVHKTRNNWHFFAFGISIKVIC